MGKSLDQYYYFYLSESMEVIEKQKPSYIRQATGRFLLENLKTAIAGFCKLFGPVLIAVKSRFKLVEQASKSISELSGIENGLGICST
jgi:hypothetical protein